MRVQSGSKLQAPKAPVEPQVTAPGTTAAAPAAGWKPVAGAEPTTTQATEARTRAAAEQLFRALGAGDHSALETAYAPTAQFKDDMFTLTRRSSILTMWKKAPPFKTFSAEVLEVKGREVHARWVVDYEMFGRKIHNEIDSRLTFNEQGQVTAQRDHWDPAKWMSQALPFIPRWAQGAAYFVMRPLLSRQVGG